MKNKLDLYKYFKMSVLEQRGLLELRWMPVSIYIIIRI